VVRRQTLQDLLARAGRLSVDELARALGVSSITVRRDLTTLEQQGLLTRTHGAALLHPVWAHERSFADKERERQPQKYAIAHEVARLMQAGMAVYLDTGTTAVHVARCLPTHLNLRVFTNNLRVALELLGREGVEVLVFGGVQAAASPDLIGELAANRIREFRMDLAVIGADALDPASGEFYAADMPSALLSRAAQEQAAASILAVDSSKFGQHSLAVIGRLQGGVTLVTDADANAGDRKAIAATGAKAIYTSIARRQERKRP